MSGENLPLALVIEGAEEGSFVGHVAVRDPDSGSNGRFSCQVEDYSAELKSNNFRLEQTSLNDFRLVTSHSHFDRETVARLVDGLID